MYYSLCCCIDYLCFLLCRPTIKESDDEVVALTTKLVYRKCHYLIQVDLLMKRINRRLCSSVKLRDLGFGLLTFLDSHSVPSSRESTIRKLDCLTTGGGTNRLSRNVCKEEPPN